MKRVWKKGMERGIKQGVEQGFERGKIETARENARRLLAMDLPVEKIAEVTDLSLNTILSLKKE